MAQGVDADVVLARELVVEVAPVLGKGVAEAAVLVLVAVDLVQVNVDVVPVDVEVVVELVFG